MAKLWIAILALCIIHHTAGQCDTDNGWQELNGDCFRVSRSAPETQYTWQEARQACLAEGGDLASIHGLEEQTFIIALAAQVGLTGSDLWIGMNQLEAKSGPFSWSDGSTVDYTYWALNMPLTGGLTFCGYTVSEDGPGPFQRSDYTSVIYGLLTPGYDRPQDADGVDTFYFGGGYSYDQDWCESRCEAHPRCAGYSWYYYHWDYYWEYQCVGRSDRYNILEYDGYSNSGVRSLGAGPYGWWYSSNCGLNRAFACRKEMGSDTPITVPTPEPLLSFCPDGYFNVDGDAGTSNKCFRIVTIDFELQAFRWDQALLLCRSGPGLNPDLASIANAEEQALLTSKLQSVTWGHWIGKHYIDREDVWVWSDNAEPNFAYWAPGQPDGSNDQCVEMWSSHDPVGGWNDLSCSSQRGYVCQTFKDPDNTVPTPMPTTPTTCAEGWTPYWYACYQAVSEPNTWQEASDYCRSIGGELASIHSDPENAALFYGVSQNLQFPAWIGLSKNQESGAYVWLDGWPDIYFNFDVNGTVGGEGCVMQKDNSKWQDTTCSSTHPFICKQTDTPTPTVPTKGEGFCPQGNWFLWGSHCYQFNSETVEFNDALINCRVAGGATHTSDLVSIESELENEFIKDYLLALGLSGAWIGLIRDPATVDQYMWTDNTEVGYLKWAPGEPSDPVFEVCTEIFRDNWPGMWNDIRCSSTDYVYKSYICEADLGPSPTYPAVPTSAPGECPSLAWQKYESDCYLFMMRDTDYRTWHESVEACKILTGGLGTLASISTVDENNFIWFWAEFNSDEFTYSNHIWIGLFKTGYQAPFQWEDGSTVDFTYWAPGEPNDQDGTSNCVRMYVNDIGPELATRWDDYTCGSDYENGYVCKVPQGSFAGMNLPKEPPPKKRHDMKPPKHEKNAPKDYKPVIDSSHTLQLLKDRMREVNHLQDIDEVPKDFVNIEHRHSKEHIEQHKATDDANTGLKAGQTVSIVLGAAIAVVGTVVIVAMVLVKRRKKQTVKTETNVAVISLEEAY